MKETKESVRKRCLQRHKKVRHNTLLLDTKVNARLEKELSLHAKRGSVVLFYLPLPFEANIMKTLRKMRSKYRIYVPFMEGKSFKMVPYRLPLKRKKFGIYEAGNSLQRIKNLDIAVVPSVGIDKNFKRIGFGKGMYDRFFANLKKKPYTIFLQRKLCKTDASVCDRYDISADVILTSETRLEKRNR